MGPLVGKSQVDDVRHNLECIGKETELVYGGDFDGFEVTGDKARGAFFPATLF
jgi:hypothetical protein